MENAAHPKLAPEKGFWRWFLACLFGANAAAFYVASIDRSWTAFGIAVLFGPGVNVLFAVVGYLALFPLRKRQPHMDTVKHLLVTLGAPTLMAAILYISIYHLGLRGG